MRHEAGSDNRAAEQRVQRVYRTLAVEQTPASIDAAVLAVAGNANRRRPARWMAPVALAASVTLALGIVLQTQNGAGNAPGALLPDPAIAVHQAAIESRAQKMGEPAREKAGGSTAVFDEASDTGVPGVADEDSDSKARANCSPAERRRPADWRSCIAALESAGETAAAATERVAMLRAFPGQTADAD